MIKKIKSLPKKAVDTYIAPVPTWAKIVRNVGIIIGALGANILSSPALFPAELVAAATYMVWGGNLAAFIAQGFKK